MRPRGAAAMCSTGAQNRDGQSSAFAHFMEKSWAAASGSVEIALNVKILLLVLAAPPRDKNNKLERNFMFLWRCVFVLALCMRCESVKREYCTCNKFVLFGYASECFFLMFVALFFGMKLNIKWN